MRRSTAASRWVTTSTVALHSSTLSPSSSYSRPTTPPYYSFPSHSPHFSTASDLLFTNKIANPAVQSRIVAVEGGLPALLALGFVSKDGFLELAPAAEAWAVLGAGLTRLRAALGGPASAAAAAAAAAATAGNASGASAPAAAAAAAAAPALAPSMQQAMAAMQDPAAVSALLQNPMARSMAAQNPQLASAMEMLGGNPAMMAQVSHDPVLVS